MNKRLGYLSLFGVTALLVAMVGVITAMAAPSAATVDATIKFDKSYYTNGEGLAGASAKITVEDADANKAKPQREVGNVNANLAIGELIVGRFSGNIVLTNKNIVGTPKAVVADALTDSAGDLVNAAHEYTDLEVQVVSSALGIVNILSGATADYGTIDILYKTSEIETVLVTVFSDQDPTGLVDLVVNETGVDTGKFEVTVTISALATPPMTLSLKALHGQTITVQHKDATPASGTFVTVNATAIVETGEPTYSGLLPVHKFSTQANQPVTSGTINDTGGSGIDISTVKLWLDRDKSGVFDAGESFAPTIVGVDGDATVTFSFTPALLVEGLYLWQVETMDLAGNTAFSDAVLDITDTPLTRGDNPHELRVDISAPLVDFAWTGKYWDADAKAEKGDKLDRLVLVFKEDLSSASVEPEDFVVEGLTPLAADLSDSDNQNRVYLTLATNLLAAAEPVLALASGRTVGDQAGNTQTGLPAAFKAIDKIAPTFTVTLDVTLSKTDVVVTVSGNEKISGIPTVQAFYENLVDNVPLTVVVKTSTSWDATFSKVAGKDGNWSVEVAGNDLKGNARTSGDRTMFKAEADKVFVFTQDTTAPTVGFTSADVVLTVVDAKVFTTNPFITATFDEKDVTVDTATFDLKAATTPADVTAVGKLSDDGKQWVYRAINLVEDSEYTITVTATDKAGNTVTKKSASFTVKAAVKTKVALSPGMNLVSLPGVPVSNAINDVIDVADVVSVITYDPINPDPVTGAWKSATRDAAGILDGSLKTIDDMHAYWVQTTSFAPIEVELPGQAFQALPPSIQVVAGWNLVPVVTIQGLAPGAQINAAEYFRSVSWEAAYTYNTVADTWMGIAAPGKFDFVTVGTGYWLYVSQNDILVP